jgi:hypothetical protein
MGTLRAAHAAALIAIACVACEGREREVVQVPPSISIAEIEQVFEADLVALAATPCDRPVLRGEPATGSGTEALRELVTPRDPELVACAARWRDLPRQEKQDRRTCDDLRDSVHCAWRPVSAAAREALGACGPRLEGAVRAAVAHGASCGPTTLAAGAAENVQTMTMLQLVSLLHIHVQELAAAGRALDAVRLALDAAQASLDQTRGGATWIEATYTTGLVSGIASLVGSVTKSPALAADELSALAREVERLLGGVPSVQDTLLADLAYILQHGSLAYLRGDEAAISDDFRPSSRAEAELAARSVHATRAMVIELCPRGALPAACAAALDGVDLELTLDPYRMVALIAMPGLAGSVRKYARMVALLHALHVELTIAARVTRDGACPADGGAGWPEVAAALAAPGLGLPLALARGGADGEWHVVLPRGLGAEPRATPLILSRFACRDGRLVEAAPPAAPPR